TIQTRTGQGTTATPPGRSRHPEIMMTVTRRSLRMLILLAMAGTMHAQGADWPANGRDVHGTRYLPARQITRENVSRLEVAWSYSTGEAGPAFATAKPGSFEATPIVVDDVMYVGTPLGRIIA